MGIWYRRRDQSSPFCRWSCGCRYSGPGKWEKKRATKQRGVAPLATVCRPQKSDCIQANKPRRIITHPTSQPATLTSNFDYC